MIFRCLRSSFRVSIFKMSSSSNVALLPKDVRGMKELDCEKFECNVKVAVLNISSKKVSKILSICKPYFLKLKFFKPLQNLNEDDAPTDAYRSIYFNPDKIMVWKDFNENERKIFNENDITEANLSQKELRVSYKNFNYDEIFNAVLPEGLEKVSGFSQIGHIIHVNLRPHLLPYKKFIGSVLLDKIKNCRTVVNKLSSIDSEYRNFNMEVIAGYEDFMVTVKEHYCTFDFDFSTVYWNPRLAKEHGRVLSSIKSGDVLFDVFCGVGPFAVPAAKMMCRVFANDLNPESFRWLNHNMKKNKVDSSYYKTFNIEGKDFITTVFKKFIENCCKGEEVLPTDAKMHVTMNLPGLAVEFLKYFNGLIDDIELFDKFSLDIFVYCYCFSHGENALEEAKQLVIDHMERDIESDILDLAYVRNVSPKKDMIKVTFRLTKESLFGVKISNSDLNEPVPKKRCMETTTLT